MKKNETFINVNGVRVRYDMTKCRKKGARTVVLIHGFGASMESWDDMYPLIRTEFNIIRYDLRGHGLSEKPIDNKYSIEEQADILMKLLAELKVKNVRLVGHSFGGGVALVAAIKNRNPLVQGVVIEDMVLIDSAGYSQRFPFFLEISKKKPLQMVASFVPAKIRARFLLERIMKIKSKITESRVRAYARYFDAPGYNNALNRTARSLSSLDDDLYVRQYREISIPVLIIWGADDPVIPLGTAYRLSGDIKNSEVIVLDGVGHIPHEENPRLVAKLITDFGTQE